MKTICMVAIQHSIKDDRIFYKEARTLTAAGFKIIYLCAANENGQLLDMGGDVINTDGKLTFEIEGVSIIGIPLPKGKIQKTLNKINQSSFYKAIIEQGIKIKADVYHAHEPQSLYIAQKISESVTTKVIYDAHEPWVNTNKKDGVLRKLLLPKLKYLISANQITRGDLLFNNHEIKSEVIYNTSVPSIFEPNFDKSKLKNPIIVHEGSLWFDRGLKEIIEVIRILKKDFPSIKFKIVGETFNDEKTYLTEKISEYGLLENIIETGWLQYKDVGKHLTDCSIGLITNTNVTTNTLAGPANKFFNYLTYGIATVAMDLPETTLLLNQTKSGITIKNRSVEALAKAIRLLLNDSNKLENYCTNAFKAYNSFNWNEDGKKLVRFYNDVIFNDSDIIVR